MQAIISSLFEALLVALTSPLLTAQLVSGQDTTESFGINGRTDSFDIVATAGGFLQVGMGVTNGNIQPRIEIFQPNGDSLAEEDNTVRDGITVKTTAPVTGTYRIQTSALNNVNGNYRLTAVSAPAPLAVSDDNAALTSGQSVEGSIPLGDLDVFTIEATAGASLRIGIGRTDGSFDSAIELIDPTGESLDFSSTAGNGTQIRAQATVTGTYTIVVSERSGFRSGDYRLSAFVSGEPILDNSENGALASGQRISGELAFGDFDAFTFSAAPGDVIRIAAGNQLTNFQAEIEIFGPDGLLLDDTQSVTTSNTEFTAPTAGTYTALISDDFGTTASEYQVTLVTLPTNEIVADNGINRLLTSGNTIERTMNRNELHFFSLLAPRVTLLLLTSCSGPM